MAAGLLETARELAEKEKTGVGDLLGSHPKPQRLRLCVNVADCQAAAEGETDQQTARHLVVGTCSRLDRHRLPCGF